jgi:hypothetical protein
MVDLLADLILDQYIKSDERIKENNDKAKMDIDE